VGASKAESILRDERFAHRPLNGCGVCQTDFTSLRLFEAHRVGDHALDWAEDENGRRCLDVEERQALGWRQDDKGRWFDPARAEDARRRLRHVAAAQTGAPRVEPNREAA
jgi:hypothetical protein